MRFVTVRHTVTTYHCHTFTRFQIRGRRGERDSRRRRLASSPPRRLLISIVRRRRRPSVPSASSWVSPHRYRRPYPYSAVARPSAESITMKPSRLVASLIVGSISRTISFAPSPIHSAGTVSRLGRATQPIREIRHGRKRHPHLPHTHCSHATELLLS